MTRQPLFSAPRLRDARVDRPARAAARAAALLALALAATACSGTSSPVAPSAPQTRRSTPPPVADFVYVSNASGTPQLYAYHAGTSTRLTFDNSTDVHPRSAAGRLVFTSYRDGNPEIYLSNLDGSGQVRLTTAPGLDDEAALDPTGTRIVFVSDRGGVPQLWTMDTTGASVAPLVTGAASSVPEVAPAWSPSGDRIAFTSTRSGLSQVYVVSAAGGTAVQLTHESGGAFEPAWSADGSTIFFTSGSGTPYIRTVDVATGGTTDYAQVGGKHPKALGQPACNASLCLAVEGAGSSNGDIVALTAAGATPSAVVATAADESSPAFLVP